MTLAEAVEKLERLRMLALRDAALAVRGGNVDKAEAFNVRARALREAVAILMEVTRG